VAVGGPFEIEGMLPGQVERDATECAEPEVWRVESGAAIPAECDRVVPVSDTVIVGKGRIRLERVPGAGEGILHPRGKKPGATTGQPLRFEVGTSLGERLRALLTSRGIRTVPLRLPFTVAVATVGNELIDSRVSPEPGQRSEVTATWLEGAISRLGLEPLPLGILPDTPEGIRDAIFRIRRRAKVLLVVGGIGDGLTDRTVDGVRRFDTNPIFTRLELDGCCGMMFSKTQGIDILGLSGRPLEAAAGYDLFVQPGLLSMLGAQAPSWDWTAVERAVELSTIPAALLSGLSARGLRWAVRPVATAPSATGHARLRVIEAETHLYPVVPEQVGWAVFPLQGQSGEIREGRRGYFQPMSGF
jgi:molybdopterin biosynthesis enzyme